MSDIRPWLEEHDLGLEFPCIRGQLKACRF